MKKSILFGVALVSASALPLYAQPAEPASGDDLAKAADATADAAALGAATPPAATPAAAPAAAPAGDDIDLASMGLDPASAGGGSFDDKLNIYGFADFTYTLMNSNDAAIKDQREFSFGNLNLYLAKAMSPKWRSLAEVRFLLTPNGSTAPDQSTMSSINSDPGNFNRDIAWGGVSIQRAYLEYDLHPNLTVRAGIFLTPYGIWNIDHGSPAIVGTTRPYIIGEGFFPEHQTGIEAFGSRQVGDYKIEYHGTVSNGRNPVDQAKDLDKKLAFGGRLAVEAPFAGTIKVGVSAYHGRSTDLAPTGSVPSAFTENSFGADAQWKHGGLLVQGEVLIQKRKWRGTAPPTLLGTPSEDGDATGGYVLAGYRTDKLWNVMPYAYVEKYSPYDGFVFSGIYGFNVGLNFRPVPSVVLKLNYAHATFGDDGFVIKGTSLDAYSTQLAWMF
jgi:hypothetical protein